MIFDFILAKVMECASGYGFNTRYVDRPCVRKCNSCEKVC